MTETARPTPNQKIRYERERRCWSQQELADMVGTTPLNVGRWERGVTSPNPYFRQKLCEIFEKNAQQLGLIPERADIDKPDEPPSSTATATPPLTETTILLWNVPYRRNLFFTGREDALASLRNALTSQYSVAFAQPQAISGLGGIGKTQTAIEYAYRYREDYDAVLWARADSYDLLVSDFLLIAALLNLPERNEHDQGKVVKAVMRWFDAHDRWLLILDNADNIEMVNEFIPSTGKGHILLTTRAHSTGTVAQRIALEKMDVEEGTLFLLYRAKRLKGHAPLETIPEAVRRQAQAIVETIEGLPLALDQAAAYIEETGCGLDDYLKFYKTRRNRLLRMRGRDASGHPEPVAATWSLSFEKVERANPAAAELLRQCAFLHPDAIPEAMIMEDATEPGGVLQPIVKDEFDLNDAIGELHKYSLVKRDPEMKILNIHRLVQVVIKDGMSQDMQREWAERTVRMVNRAFPDPEKVDMWPICQQYLPHTQVCADLIEQWKLLLPEAAHLVSQAGKYLQERAQYEVAEPLYLQALAIREEVLGVEHLVCGTSLNDLASLYTIQGKYKQAEPLYQHALAIREQVLGANHPAVADSLDGLAINYHEQGEYEQAEPLYQRALAIREQELGPKHLLIAMSFNNLAFLYHDQGKFERAELLHQRALTIREQELGPNHPSVAESLCNLGVLYHDQGKYEQSEPLYQRALLIGEYTLGPNHPDVALGLNNLALLYWKQGKYEKAEPLYRRALAIWEKVLGPNHSDVATCLNNLAKLYHDQGRFEQSEPLHQRALSIREQQLGLDHPDVAYSLNNLALLYEDQGKHEQSELLHQRALSIREYRLGSRHPLTATSLNNLAKLYHSQGNFEQAEALYQRALSIREQVLGVEHQDVATTMVSYADLLCKTGRDAEAIELEGRAQAIRVKQEQAS